MISRSRSSRLRSPPLASGCRRFTSSLYLALISVPDSLPSRSSASNERRAKLPSVLRGFSASAPGLPPLLPKKPNGSTKASRPACRPGADLADAHVPGRPVADRGGALVFDDVVLGHPREIVVGLVVLAHMVEAVAVVLPLAVAPLRRTIAAGLLTARPFAAGRFLGSGLRPVGPDADAVEVF